MRSLSRQTTRSVTNIELQFTPLTSLRGLIPLRTRVYPGGRRYKKWQLSEFHLGAKLRNAMFELPEAKRVKREELCDSDSEEKGIEYSPEDAEVLRAKLNARLSNLISLDFGNLDSAVDDQVAVEDTQEQDPEFDFRLFSSSKGLSTKVLLTTAEEDILAGSEGTILSKRPQSFYVRGQLTPAELQRLRQSARSGRDIIMGAKERAWGLEVPWRVQRISLSTDAPSEAAHAAHILDMSEHTEKAPGKKKRPGKKRRITLRVRDKAREEKEKAELDKKMTKEEHLKEKKKRLNREKKLKRRAKEREKKASHGGGVEDDGASSSAGD